MVPLPRNTYVDEEVDYWRPRRGKRIMVPFLRFQESRHSLIYL